LDTLVNNAGLMLLARRRRGCPGVGPHDAINVQGLLSTTRAADVVNISSIAGRVAWNGYGAYSFTKFGVRGFTKSLRQEVTQRHLRVGVLEPGGVVTELGSHNKPEVRNQMIGPFL
jgi:NADP-dependent 3-hydroxy acid dehydrogenase YdfG